MNVRCHCSAPPDHPPMAKAFGQLSRSFCGIFAPKLGNARKICKPLPTITNSDTAFTQWHSRTINGWSYTDSVTSPVFAFSISIARLAMFQTPLKLETVVIRIALIFPVSDLRQYVRHLEAGEIFRLLVSNLGRDVQPHRRAMFAGQRLPVHFIAQQSLRMQRRSE